LTPEILQVGSINATGKRYTHHYDIWVVNLLQEYGTVCELRGVITGGPAYTPPAEGWVNGNLYTRTTEEFGIVSVDESLRNQLSMLPFDQGTQMLKKTHHRFLAMKQNTKLPVLPVHSDVERKHFSMLMQDSTLLTASGKVKYIQVAKQWNQAAIERPELFYKVIKPGKQHITHQI